MKLIYSLTPDPKERWWPALKWATRPYKRGAPQWIIDGIYQHAEMVSRASFNEIVWSKYEKTNRAYCYRR